MKAIIKSQYTASLTMLRGAIDACDDTLWTASGYPYPFWRVAYHTLFYTGLYLSPSLDDFAPWEKHVDELESMGPMIHKDGKLPKDGPAYAKKDIEAYFDTVLAHMALAVGALDFDAPSGFFWLPFSKLELQFYNIRHVQHHAGQLAERVRVNLDKEVGWVGAG